MSQLKESKEIPIESSFSQEENQYLQKTISKSKNLLIDILIVFCFAYFMCIYKIEVGSFGSGDQTTHSLVVQEMNRSGDYLHPKYHGRGYYNKPPFKMWLVAIAVKFLGESNFSYRVIDGLTGIAISIMLFVFSYQLFSSRIAAYFSVFALLGSHLFFFGHGIRNAVQDGMMLFLMSLGIICGWYLLESSGDRRRVRKLSITGGILTGLAALTKNVAGYFSFVIIGLYVLFTGKTKEIISKYYFEICLSILISLMFPLLFLVAQGDEFKNAWEGLIISEVYKRAVKGYHHIKHYWFYWNIIVKERLLVPPELLAFSSLFALTKILINKDKKFTFLLIWAFAPVIIQNSMKSKLEWYILPALPGMCLLVGATISFSIEYLKKHFNSKSIISYIILLFIIYSTGVLTFNNYSVAKFFLTGFRKNAAELISQEIRDYGFANQKMPTIAFYQAPKLANHEMLYFAMQPIQQIEVKSLDELKVLIMERKVDFVISVKKTYNELAALSPVAVASLQKRDQRKRRINIFAFNPEIIPSEFFEKLPNERS